jgi:tetratricopeptide (TPR) repeat protein
MFSAMLGTETGKPVWEKFAINLTPTTLVLGPDGTEVDWFAKYSLAPEKFKARLEKILRGEETYKSLQNAYDKGSRDVATVFLLARKWADRLNPAKEAEKYREVLALDPKGLSGSYTDSKLFITAPYAEYAAYYLAAQSFTPPATPDLQPLRDFIAGHSRSRLVKQAYRDVAEYYGWGEKSDKEADDYADFMAHDGDDVTALRSWLRKVVQDKGPVERGLELASRLREWTGDGPSPAISQAISRAYDLAGDRENARELYGKEFLSGRIDGFANDLVDYADYWMERKENTESAVAAAQLAVRIDPDKSLIRQRVVRAYLKAGEVAKSLEVYGPAWVAQKAAEKSDTELMSFARFWFYLNQNTEGALDATKKAIEIDPKAPFNWALLAEIHLKMGDRAMAIAASEKAVELAKGDAKTRLQKRLEAIKATPPAKK